MNPGANALEDAAIDKALEPLRAPHDLTWVDQENLDFQLVCRPWHADVGDSVRATLYEDGPAGDPFRGPLPHGAKSVALFLVDNDWNVTGLTGLSPSLQAGLEIAFAVPQVESGGYKVAARFHDGRRFVDTVIGYFVVGPAASFEDEDED